MATDGAPRTITLPTAGRPSDDVAALRHATTERAHPLPAGFTQLTIGAGEECAIRIVDPTVSRVHAAVERRGSRLVVTDPGSKNGLWLGEDRVTLLELVPAGSFRLGGVELVAASPASERSRRVMQRLLGWTAAAAPAVERAHQAVHRRSHVVVVGAGGGLALARAVHGLAGVERLVVAGDQDVATSAAWTEVVAAAARGTLVLAAALVRADRPWVAAGLRFAGRAVVIAARAGDAAPAIAALAPRAHVVEVPPLATRRADLGRIVDERAAELAAEAGVASAGLTAHDRAQLLACAWPGDLDELDATLMRLVSVRTHRSMRQAAAAMGLSPSAMSSWAKRYGFVLG